MEFRKDVSDSCYAFALNQFEKHFCQENGFTEKQQQLLHHIKIVNDVYKPHRVFRRTNTVPFKDLSSKVQVTLLEYGYRSNIGHTEKENARNNSDIHLEEQEIDQIMDNMAEMNEETFDYDELPEEDREKISAHYKKLKKQFEVSNSLTNEKNQLANLMDRREDLINSLEQSNIHKLQLKKNVEETKELIKKIKLEQNDINAALQDLNSEENDSEKSKEVERLLLHGDNLEKQKTEFEENCVQESLRLNSSIEAAEKKSDISDTKCEEYDNRIENENEKLKVLRLQMAKKNRAISTLQRRIDEVPSRAELAQYQKRFIELYNQISAKHKETKQYYSLYNTLEDTRQYMKKELSLLNSIIDNYPEAMRSKEGKEEFLQQFLKILEGVKHSKLKLEKRLSQEKKKRDELGDSLHSFIEMNRKYATAIKVLKAEFQKNEEFIKNATIEMT